MKHMVLTRISVITVALFFLTGVAGAAAKDKIVIGQAVSLSGPLATSNAVVSSPYYDLWAKDVNAEGGIYVKGYGKRLPVELHLFLLRHATLQAGRGKGGDTGSGENKGDYGQREIRHGPGTFLVRCEADLGQPSG